MELNKGHIAFAVACFIAGSIVGGALRGCTIKPDGELVPPMVVHDTVTVRDTVRIQAKTKTVAVHDTVFVVDTTTTTTTTTNEPQMLVYETKEYRDTFATDSSRIELGIQFSGYKAQIDAIDLTQEWTVQPRVIEKKRGWGQFIGVGIGVGYGASVVGNRVYAAPEIGVHVTYGFGYTWKK